VPKNNLRKLREKAGLTQRQLAAKAKTNQQQIQRIETGTRIARFDLAMRLCAALNVKPENIFPAAQLPLARYRKSLKEKAGDVWSFDSQIASAGLDIDPRNWAFRIALCNGYQADLPIDGPDQRSLLSNVQTDKGFLVFNSGEHRYAINTDHLDFCHFLYDVGAVERTDNASEEATAEIYFANRLQPTVLELGIAESGGSERDYDNEEPNQFDLLFMSLDGSNDFDGMMGIEDEDGEYAFFRPSSVAMLKVSLLAIEPNVVEATFSSGDEMTANEPAKQDQPT